VIESAAMLCLVAALASSALLFRAQRQLWDARAVGAVLETVPLEWFRWPAKRANADIHNKASGYRDFLARLLADDALQLEKARLALQLDGIPFSAMFVTRSGAAYAVEGRRAPCGDAVVWLLDASAAVTVRRARQEATDLRQMLDAIPLPVWRRSVDRGLTDCNRAYASARRSVTSS
jgi:PAS domain-containing protein